MPTIIRVCASAVGKWISRPCVGSIRGAALLYTAALVDAYRLFSLGNEDSNRRQIRARPQTLPRAQAKIGGWSIPV